MAVRFFGATINVSLFWRRENEQDESIKNINEMKTIIKDGINAKNGEGDLVLMSIDAFEKREQMLQLRARVLQAEQERIDGEPTISVSEARKRLRERASEA